MTAPNNNAPFNIMTALQNAKGQTVLAFDVNGKHHYGKLVVAHFSPIAHMILQCDDEQRIVLIQNCTSIVPNPTRAPGQIAGHKVSATDAERAQRLGMGLLRLMNGAGK